MSRRTRQRSSLAMLAVVALFVGDPIVVGAHLLLHPHYWCAEHGTIEHVRGDHDDGPSLPGFDPGLFSAPLPSPAPREHVACHAQDLSQRGETTLDRQGESACPLSARGEPSPPSQPVRATTWLFVVAPKQSPPA